MEHFFDKKEGILVYKFITQNPYMHKTKSKAKKQHFYCCFSSQSLQHGANIVFKSFMAVHIVSIGPYEIFPETKFYVVKIYTEKM